VREALARCGLVPVDANVLLAHAVGRDRAWLAAHRDDELSKSQADAFFTLAKRRREGEPVAYLTGVKEFWGLPLRVSNAVLVPRPETETLVELALEWIRRDTDARVLDLATGSGAIALAIAPRAAARARRRHRRIACRTRGRMRQRGGSRPAQRHVRRVGLVETPSTEAST
jgi:release factor glutamine methyltransferase